ncbi:transcriptional repressor p66-beta-like isoform X1 [Odontomachus brunneus]|uniref:transcriptional repressor p66-beta-like isoform X1 n=1 Tax=Odontomachus brunneus TaxID=486640 RepID=UPI0013F243DA|nr:transcriptional repressor p66-beta-like isoform X1 [Odontomachus brunneus]XP_032680788.1 transcriptional repressor p66-beta-like isoform X1 [Odontomachus brunneus]XP_032680789.1 transcriptional repressor p66-beta-like isoform X1 [Odontomachus brunneus]XP_032680790.1 transcriptional repressor p66-beta-like isoform X1 [Odontomachus brunneus]XP_032680791.1 transcriptional repressor p66-beta-like isoform X1 [Odontomachus brunneus]
MEAMDLDGDAVVDLSVSSSGRRNSPSVSVNSGDVVVPLDLGIHIPTSPNLENNMPEARNIQNAARGILAPKSGEDRKTRRSLRPRIERSYAESPDEPRMNGYLNGNASDSEEGELPPLLPIKELSSDELAERERMLRKLKEELKSEEMKLVLLKKLRQSQQLKENIAVPKAPSKLPPPVTAVQQTPHSHRTGKAPPPLLRGQPAPSRSSSLHAPPPGMVLPPTAGRNATISSTGIPPNMVIPQPPHPRGRPPSTTPNVSSYHAPADRTERSTKDPTPAPAHQLLVGSQENKTTASLSTPVNSEQERQREDNQTPAQRQAAAKLALRKQLEKTLLQIPPPKPPPPEMHFVPNPSNTEFIYLVGLEHVVDFITKEPAVPPPPEPFECSQCKTDFTPVWKWEKNLPGGNKDSPRGQHATFQRPAAGRDPRVICEHCVTTNVKKALKAEHTNRLKTAFVKALQQEQEIEQRLAQAGCPSPDPPAPKPVPKAATPTRRVATPPAPLPQVPPPAPTLTPTPPAPKMQEHPLVKLAESGKFSPHHAAAAAALQQQLLRELAKNPVPGIPPHQPLPAHMMPPFTSILYPYQLAMAQAAGGKGLVELQRQAADLQRQYLLDMIPSQASQAQGNQAPPRAHPHNWKT